MSTRALSALAAASLLLLGASEARRGGARLIWNLTPSAPLGLYLVRAGARPQVGDLVAFAPSPPLADWLDAAGYAPRGALLLKTVAASGGARVCRDGAGLTVDGRVVARARARDRAGRDLPSWVGCRRLGAGELMLLNAPSDSVDGRYFGPVRREGVTGVARRIGRRAAPARRP